MIYKKGDRVYDISYGWGRVVDIDIVTKTDYPVTVDFDNGKEQWYTLGGALHNHCNPCLSFKDYSEGFNQERPLLKIEEGTPIFVKHKLVEGWHLRRIKSLTNRGALCYKHNNKDGAVTIWPIYSLENPLL